PVVIVHVSNRESMEEIARARARGIPVAGETCPQYLVLTAEDLEREGMEGAKFVCSPPPRDVASQIACWEGIEQGVFDVFSSDHCPFRFDDEAGKLTPKGRRNFRWIPNGIPGVETRLPILFSEGVAKGRIDIHRFVALTATNHARLYGLYPRKGTIAVGADADIVLWDPRREETITQDRLHHGCDYTPYEGMKVTGWPVRTMVRGVTVALDGVVVGPAGHGQYLPRARSSLYRPAQASDEPHRRSRPPSSPIRSSAFHRVKATESRIGTPSSASIRGAMTAPRRLVHRMTMASGADAATSRHILSIVFSSTSEKAWLSEMPRWLSATTSMPASR